MYRHRLRSGNPKPRKPANTDLYQSILNLNDDCLYEVLVYLSLQDLYSMGSTCRRINIIAKSHYKRFANLDARYFLIKSHRRFITNRKMNIIIKQIAHHVKSFEISYNNYEENGLRRCQYLIKLVLLHCNNIISLEVDFRMDPSFIQEMCRFENFQKLEKIDVVGHGEIPLEKLVRLKHLVQSNTSNDELLILKNLESLSTGLISINAHAFSKFCDNNPDMKKLHLNSVLPIFVDLIVDKLKRLEDIALFRSDYVQLRNSERISEIKSLKSFTGKDFPGLLKKLSDIDQLELLTYSKPTPEEANLISKFTKLKYLRVQRYNDIQLNSLKSRNILEHLDLNGSDVTNIGITNFVSGANSLKYLSLCRCFDCDHNLLDMLSNFIKMSNRTLKLTIKCDFIYRSQRKDYPLLDIICESFCA